MESLPKNPEFRNNPETHASLVLVQPRKTCPCLTERLLMGHKESNQTNKQNSKCLNLFSFLHDVFH